MPTSPNAPALLTPAHVVAYDRYVQDFAQRLVAGSSAKWLVAHEYLPDAYVKLESWRPDMKELFDAIAPNNAPEAPTPRHSGTELSAIFGVLGDPRLVLYERLLPLIITDQREESLASVRRSALNLNAGVATLYLTWTRQRRDKSVLPLSRTVRLSTEARGLLEEALSVRHLQPLEARYLAEGSDYPLFPAALDAVDGVSSPALCASSPNLLELDPRICLAIELGGERRRRSCAVHVPLAVRGEL